MNRHEAVAARECNGPRDCIGTEQGCDHCGVVDPPAASPPTSRPSTPSLDRIEAEAVGEIEWLEGLQRRNMEVRERLRWIRRCLYLIKVVRDV